MRTLSYAVALMTMAGALATRAEEGAPPPRGEGQGPGRFMERIDKDGDGKISVAEFAAARGEMAKFRFTRLDADSDGKVTEAEFKAAMEKMPKPPEGSDRPVRELPTFAELDANKDGAVTAEESTALATTKAAEKAKELDKNSDGFLTREEMPMRGGPGGEGGPRRHGPPGEPKE